MFTEDQSTARKRRKTLESWRAHGGIMLMGYGCLIFACWPRERLSVWMLHKGFHCWMAWACTCALVEG
jgi:hypothetical protein